MTSKEFKDIQKQLDLTNKAMAEVLKTAIRNVDNWRSGRIRVPGPVIVALYFLIERQEKIHGKSQKRARKIY